MRHELKILPEFFDAVCNKIKNFEIRKADRDFKVGDTLILREWNGEKFTGKVLCAAVTYIFEGNSRAGFGVMDGYCVMAIKVKWAN